MTFPRSGNQMFHEKIKARLFSATVESVLFYGCETWTLTPAMEKSLDGCYTRMLRAAFNISWRDMVTNAELYQGIQKVTEKIRAKRLQFVGHCQRHPELPVQQVLLWHPTHGTRSRGRPATNFTKQLMKEAQAETVEELKQLIESRDLWRSISGARPWPPE